MLAGLGEDGDISVLVIEQNIGVATAVSRPSQSWSHGRVNRLIESSRLAADRDLQQRLPWASDVIRKPSSRSMPRRRRCRGGLGLPAAR